MPNNKSDLYDFFINRRLQQEDDKNIKKTSYIKRKGYYSLQKIAIAIQLMNVNDLSDNEILDFEHPTILFPICYPFGIIYFIMEVVVMN